MIFVLGRLWKPYMTSVAVLSLRIQGLICPDESTPVGVYCCQLCYPLWFIFRSLVLNALSRALYDRE